MAGSVTEPLEGSGKWGYLANILRREGWYMRRVGRFYVEVVKAVLMFGSGPWFMTPPGGEIP